jgi:predicted DNA-binding protein (UPF0251 family)
MLVYSLTNFCTLNTIPRNLTIKIFNPKNINTKKETIKKVLKSVAELEALVLYSIKQVNNPIVNEKMR